VCRDLNADVRTPRLSPVRLTARDGRSRRRRVSAGRTCPPILTARALPITLVVAVAIASTRSMPNSHPTTEVGNMHDGRRSSSRSPSVSWSSRTERVTADCARKSSDAARLAPPCSTTIVNTRSLARLRISAIGDVGLARRADVRSKRTVRQRCRRAAIFSTRALRSPGWQVVTACACYWLRLQGG